MATFPMDQRQWFMHSPHPTIGVSAWSESPATAGFLVPRETEDGRQTLRVCLVAGSPDDPLEETPAVLSEHLQRLGRSHRRLACTVESDLSACDALDPCDCLVLLDRPAMLGAARLRRIERYCRGRGSIVALRSAARALPHWPTFDVEVLGAHFQGQYDSLWTEVEAAPCEASHPLLAGVEGFTSAGSLYHFGPLAPDAELLLAGAAEGHREPLAWTRRHHGRRMFYTSLGHADDFRQPRVPPPAGQCGALGLRIA